MTITEQFKAKRCVFSIECFPPKQTTQMEKLKDTLRQMQAMDPGFISVSFGAGGSAGGGSTAEGADYIQNELHVPPLAHLICMGNDETRAAEILDQLGEMPLPPYITHKLQDKNRYQTVYAKHEGSAAAPTAGLHFTPELLEDIKKIGVHIAHVTLHVGLGTFRPVKVEDVTDHHMHSEFYIVEPEQAELITREKKEGGKIVAVGTTSCRTLESATDENGILKAGSGWTDIFIYPGYPFKMIDRLITNFHLPEATLMMLASALAGKDKIMAAYEEAVKERYRFFSFGDAMFIADGSNVPSETDN